MIDQNVHNKRIVNTLQYGQANYSNIPAIAESR